MKNVVKVLGIIAMVAVIGLAVGCSVDPEDQVEITIKDIASGANGKYAYIQLFPSGGGEPVASPSKNNQIKDGSVTALMVDDKGEAFGKEGTYNIGIYIHTEPVTPDNYKDAKLFRTYSPISIVKGANEFSATKPGNELTTQDDFPKTIAEFYASDEPPADSKIATFKGTYKAAYKVSSETSARTVNETIDLSDITVFKISDDDKGDKGTGTPDSLEFKITDWDYADVPDNYKTTYPTGFKFVGKITKSTAGYYGTDSQTGKGIVAGDIKEDKSGPDCWMYLYFSDSGKVIRTPFTKTGATENKNVVLHYLKNDTNAANGPVREYTKQP